MGKDTPRHELSPQHWKWIYQVMWHNMTKGTITSTPSAHPELSGVWLFHASQTYCFWQALKCLWWDIERISIIRYTGEYKRQCRQLNQSQFSPTTFTSAHLLYRCFCSLAQPKIASFMYSSLLNNKMNVSVSRNLSWSLSKSLSLGIQVTEKTQKVHCGKCGFRMSLRPGHCISVYRKICSIEIYGQAVLIISRTLYTSISIIIQPGASLDINDICGLAN